MKVTKIRPDIEDPLEPPEGSLSDFIVIQIDEGEVSYKSSLEDEKALFYIDLCKHIILRDWLGDGMLKHNDSATELLTILQEECAEVIQEASKVKRFGQNA